jgi:hypothetical protein
MKKFLFVSAFALCFIGLSQAQVGISVGYNISDIVLSDEGTSDSNPLSQFNVAINYDKAFNSYVYLHTGLGYMQKGAKYQDYDPTYGYSYVIKDYLHYIQVPLALRLKVGDGAKFFGQAGFYAAYCVKAKESYSDDYPSYDLGFDINKFDAGLNFGVGVQVNQLEFSVEYYRGLTDVFSNPATINTSFSFNVALLID